MKRLILLGLVVTCCGCGSATTGLISDGLNIINEVSDNLRKVVDEESAAKFADAGGKALKDKWDAYNKRVEKWVKDREDADLQEAAAFMNTDRMLGAKTKKKGAIEHIFGQRSGDLDKHFLVWAGRKGASVTNQMPPDEIFKKAKSALEAWHDSNENWFKESFAATKILKDAQNRLVATAQKTKGAKLKEVSDGWSTFLASQ